jgi:methionine synthase II (cobalamin-independent)
MKLAKALFWGVSEDEALVTHAIQKAWEEYLEDLENNDPDTWDIDDIDIKISPPIREDDVSWTVIIYSKATQKSKKESV